MKAFTCRRCSQEFVSEKVPRGQIPFWCSTCRPIAQRERDRKNMASWRARNGDKGRAYHRAYYAKNPDSYKNSQLKMRYQITLDQYKQALADQGGVCAICEMGQGDSGERMNVDHDHSCCPGAKSCGRCIRGILCGKCNRLLVAGYENLPERMRTWDAMNEYLSRLIEFDPYIVAGGQ